MKIETPGGHRINVTTEVVPGLGRVVYTVAKVGAFTVSRDPWCYNYDPYSDPLMRVAYGRDTERHYTGTRSLPDQPVIYGIEIGGAAVFHEDRAYADHSWWLPCHRWLRDDGDIRRLGPRVPDGTRGRCADIVSALVIDYLARPDRAALEHAVAVAYATMRLQQHTDEIHRLTGQIEALEARRDEQTRLADKQAVLAAQDTADRWNQAHPVGTQVVYYPAGTRRNGRCAVTTSPSRVVAGAPVVDLDMCEEATLADVEPIPEAERCSFTPEKWGHWDGVAGPVILCNTHGAPATGQVYDGGPGVCQPSTGLLL